MKLHTHRIKILSLLLILSTVYFSSSIYFRDHPVKKILFSLSEQEKEYLTNFFKFEFFIGSFGYTLFGEKPMSIDTVDLTASSKHVEDFDYMDLEHILGRYRLKEGWQVWKKYSSQFHQKNITIIDYPCILNASWIEIAIINRGNFLRVVTENLQDFHTVLGNEFSAEQILEEYLKGKGSVFNTIRNHDGLFGTLLGYGRENAWKYMQQDGGYQLKPFYSLGEFLKNEQKNTNHVLPPLFSVISDSNETIQLKTSYEEQQTKVDTIYQRKDFLEQVLLKLWN